MDPLPRIAPLAALTSLFFLATPALADSPEEAKYAIGAEILVDGATTRPMSAGLGAKESEVRISSPDPTESDSTASDADLWLTASVQDAEEIEEGKQRLTVAWELHRETEDGKYVIGSGKVSAAEDSPTYLRLDGALDEEKDPESLAGPFEVKFLFARETKPEHMLDSVAEADFPKPEADEPAE